MQKNRQGVSIDGIWTTPSIVPTACGYLEYGIWDHRPIWIEFEEASLFGHKENSIAPINMRRLKIDDSKSTYKYTKHLRKEYEKIEFLEKLKAIKNKLHNDSNDILGKNTLFDMDNVRRDLMLMANKKCRKFNAGKVHFSPTTNTSGTGIHCLKLAMQFAQGNKVSRRRIKRAQKKSEMTVLEWRKCSTEFLIDLLNHKQQEYEVKKKILRNTDLHFSDSEQKKTAFHWQRRRKNLWHSHTP